jgi:RNA polymerase sigma-70 factor (ECF subfamily)
MLGDRPLAEEVLQEVFQQVWREAGRYRPDACSPRGWVLLLAHSRGLDRLRAGESAWRARRQPAGAGGPPRDDAPAVEAAGPATEMPRAGPSSVLLSLPAEQRTAIELAFLGGLTQSEIAARLGAPLPAIRSRLLLGMKELRQALAADGRRR